MKSQTSIEYLSILGLIIIVVLITAVYAFDLPSIFVNTEILQQKEYWQSAPIGILGMFNSDDYDSITIYLINNQRLSIEIQDIFIGGENGSIENKTPFILHSGDIGIYEIALLDYELQSYFVSINYSFLGENRSFDGNGILYPLERFK